MADNRAKKSGIGAEIEKKLEQRYDQEEAAGTMNAIVVWINAILAGEHEPIVNHTQKELHKSLRDGVLLCKLINKILASEGKSKVGFQKKVASPFVAMGNIDNFNKGCTDYGLSKEFLFQSTDLWEGRKGPFLNVINCIHSLGFLANSKGFQPTYTGSQTKYLDLE
ncbi:transgelin-3 [Biomphalaria glabrata]|uniref:Transgelin-3-like n=2 Tax=Biomphalaria TaxID=6525 RepID=A0A2C9LBF9_BIOGL|nr:transgelin-3-like [Biomphalaria glabrata]KAI8760374.1 transgelin-3-like [Biomphalaria glabrata]KAI8784173.1 transgelin-3 [Biomphalaria glabrata]KAK0068102.1 transgelin-3 [Biomphalaria pfeifferi]